MGTKLSEDEKLYWVCILFPVFWIFLPFLIAHDISKGIKAWWYERKQPK